MGPNLYITPPGTFTRFHQDGFGTVDSGHLCMAGYNEVVMFRRLPRGHDRNALNIKGSSLYELPHADKLVRISIFSLLLLVKSELTNSVHRFCC